MKIIAGSSKPGVIDLSSTEFTARAIWNEETQSPVVNVYEFGQTPNSGRRLVGLLRVVLISITMVVVEYFLSHYFPTFHKWFTSAEIFVLVAITFVVTGNRELAPWHGAEHMAIAAYNRDRANCLSEISRESPVSPKCGGRFILPVFLVSWISLRMACIGVNFVGIGILLISMVLIVALDEIVGLHKIPVFSHASRWVQSFTTKQPGEKELKTAAAALAALIEKHKVEYRNLAF